MLTWTLPPGVRHAAESPQWKRPFTACTSVSMDTVVVLASSLHNQFCVTGLCYAGSFCSDID